MRSSTWKWGGDLLNIPQRVVELLILIPMSLVFLFFAYHQITNTGFFTTAFGPIEMVCFYGPMLLSLSVPLARAASGHRNFALPFEIVTNLSLALGSLWLIQVFPFDFYHLGDLFPDPFQFVLSFFTNGIGMIILILQLIGGAIGAAVAAVRFISVLLRGTGT